MSDLKSDPVLLGEVRQALEPFARAADRFDKFDDPFQTGEADHFKLYAMRERGDTSLRELLDGAEGGPLHLSLFHRVRAILAKLPEPPQP